MPPASGAYLTCGNGGSTASLPLSEDQDHKITKGGGGKGRHKFIQLGGAALGAQALPMLACAQSRYPASPIHLIVPYAPGGVVDAVARNWTQSMMEPLGTVVVENRGGGGGTIGANFVAHA